MLELETTHLVLVSWTSTMKELWVHEGFLILNARHHGLEKAVCEATAEHRRMLVARYPCFCV